MKPICSIWCAVWTGVLLVLFGHYLSYCYPFPALTYKTEHTIIKYQNESDLRAMAEGIGTNLAGLSEKVDDIFRKTEEALGEYYNIDKGAKAKIFLCNTKEEFSKPHTCGEMLWYANAVPSTGAYYRIGARDMFFYTKYFDQQLLAHEITHALVFAYLPEVARMDHEWLANAIEERFPRQRPTASDLYGQPGWR